MTLLAAGDESQGAGHAGIANGRRGIQEMKFNSPNAFML